MSRKKIDAVDPVVVEDDGTTFRCTKCGHMMTLGLPFNANAWAKIVKVFCDSHDRCQPLDPGVVTHGPWAKPVPGAGAST